jgi:hypothetical protein
MSIPLVVDGVTDADSEIMNQIINRANGNAGPLASVRSRVYRPSDYVDDADEQEDWTDALTEALADAYVGGVGAIYSTDGGGSVELNPRIYEISGPVTLDRHSSLRGAGTSNTIFKATTADSKLIIDMSRGSVGGFTFDGNGLAETGIEFLDGNGVHASDILAYNCAGDGIVCRNLQNSVMIGVNANQNGGSGFVMDDGTGSVIVIRSQFDGNFKHQISITDSDTVASGYTEPSRNMFIGCLAEYQPTADSGTATGGTATTLVDSGAGWAVNEWAGAWVTMDPGGGAQDGRRILSNTATTLTVERAWDLTPTTQTYRIHFAMIKQDAGSGNIFFGQVTAPGAGVAVGYDGGEYPVIDICRRGLTEEQSSLIIRDGLLGGADAYHIGIELNGVNTNVHFDGQNTFVNPLIGVRITLAAGSYLSGSFPGGGVTPFVGLSGGTLNNYAFNTHRGIQQVHSALASDGIVRYGVVEGEAGARWRQDADGTMYWHGGADFSYDTNLYRSAANTLKTDDSFVIGANLDHDGSNVGFYGTAPVAKQTGVAVTAGGIHAALVALGLIGA